MESLPSHRQFLTTLIESLSQTPAVAEDAAPPSSLSQPTQPLANVPSNQRHLLLTLHVLFPDLLLPALDLLDRGLVARLRLAGAEQPEDGPSGTFIVKSLSTTLATTRRTRDAALSARRYLVCLGPWNCSCANFALEAFPSSAPVDLPPHVEQSLLEWSFGGTSRDGLALAGDVPCCKHLLACLLTEKWPGRLGRYAEERNVTREEMAGLVADL